ncbi:hypothetical protein GPECTOR_3g297 [Gonium pectorale]|uniref:Misato Segment II tubulin-like domain-containing protein n=1 Tax=Gonium pectorale TaxID=33097 RepID=A0A150GZ07_GONPE|nr:hypothetical protein GPECTOR_3g297 [Gonium pectorale]|eukprot:KXZ55147.1 hypothetical protein GPECTOR_3g297 [Gonium pectorale]
MPKEIVTLSFGSYASFVSAHYWNLQDEVAGLADSEGWSEYATGVNHDVLFEETEGDGRVSFTTGGGGVALGGGGGGTGVSSWAGGCEVHRAAPVARSAFVETLEEHEELDWGALGDEEAERHQAALEAAARQLDGGGAGASRAGPGGVGDARHWTDFCKVLVSPRSVYCLPGSWSGPLAHSLAGGWGAGADMLGPSGGGGGGGELLEDALDRVRHLAEACDSMAGMQVFADDLTGFGSLACSVLAEVSEEYPGRPALLFALRQPGQGQASARGDQPATQARLRDELSEGLSLARLAEHAALYVPLATPYNPSALPCLSYDPALPFHTSAILAAALDSALLPARLTGSRSPLGEPLGATDLHSLIRLLYPHGGRGTEGSGAPLAALHLALPCASLPADLRQLQQQLDERIAPPPHRNHEPAGPTPTAATAEFEGWVGGVRRRWGRAAGATGGRAVLDSWGLGRDEAEEVSAALAELEISFAEDEDV